MSELVGLSMQLTIDITHRIRRHRDIEHYYLRIMKLQIGQESQDDVRAITK